MNVLNTFCPSIPCRSAAPRTHLLAVLAQSDQIGISLPDQAVYVGLVELPAPSSKEYDDARLEAALWVMSNGLKQTYTQALGYFPAIRRENYR